MVTERNWLYTEFNMWIRNQNITCRGIMQGEEWSQQAKLDWKSHTYVPKNRNLKTKCSLYMFQAMLKDCHKIDSLLLSLQQLRSSAVKWGYSLFEWAWLCIIGRDGASHDFIKYLFIVKRGLYVFMSLTILLAKHFVTIRLLVWNVNQL